MNLIGEVFNLFNIVLFGLALFCLSQILFYPVNIIYVLFGAITINFLYPLALPVLFPAVC